MEWNGMEWNGIESNRIESTANPGTCPDFLYVIILDIL